jgi:hypothetical protein
MKTDLSLDKSVRICSHCGGLRNTVVSAVRSDGVPKAGERKIGRPAEIQGKKTK